MFALAARARGIAPGDPERPFATDNPTIEIALTDEAGARLALYRGRAAFVAVPGEDGTFESARLYVVVDEPPAGSRGNACPRTAACSTRMGASAAGRCPSWPAPDPDTADRIR